MDTSQYLQQRPLDEVIFSLERVVEHYGDALDSLEDSVYLIDLEGRHSTYGALDLLGSLVRAQRSILKLRGSPLDHYELALTYATMARECKQLGDCKAEKRYSDLSDFFHEKGNRCEEKLNG